MGQQLSMNHQTLFQNEDVFDTDFTPDSIHARDQELRQLAETLRPALRGARPLNTIIRGPPGTGKTTCVGRVFAELESAAPRHVLPVMINCQQVLRDCIRYGLYPGVIPPTTGEKERGQRNRMRLLHPCSEHPPPGRSHTQSNPTLAALAADGGRWRNLPPTKFPTKSLFSALSA